MDVAVVDIVLMITFEAELLLFKVVVTLNGNEYCILHTEIQQRNR